MAVVTDQQGQAVRLAESIGVDQQPGSRGRPGPGWEKVVMALLAGDDRVLSGENAAT